MNINIRLLKVEEVNSVNEVYNKAYGNIRPLESFKWEFINGPWGKAIYVIAEDLDKDGNQIIGTQSAIPMIMINGVGEKVLTAKSEDTFVHPDYRGHKLFDRMYELLFEECRKAGINYLWGFTYARKPFLKLGFSIPFDTIQGLYIIRPMAASHYLSALNPSNSIKDKFKIFALTSTGYLNRLIHNFAGRPRKKNVVGKDFRIKTSLIDSQLKKDNTLWSIHQTNEYLDWRLKHNPFPNDYLQFTGYSEKNELDSAVLFNYRKEGFAYIEEINFSDPEKTKTIRELIASAIEFSEKERRPFLLRFWGFDVNITTKLEMTLLKKLGFVFVKKGTAFVWKDLTSGNGLIAPENVLLSRLLTQGNK